MRRLVLVFVVFACGCSARQASAWMPRLVVQGRVIARVESGPDRELDWRVEGALRWPLGQTRAGRAPAGSSSAAAPPAPASARCVEVALCAWEHRERMRAERMALLRLGLEEP